MSAANVYRTPDGVHLFTDGGGFGPQGGADYIIQKARIAAHQDAAFTARGPISFSDVLSFLVSQVQGRFDDLVDQFPSVCQRAHDQVVQAAAMGKPMAADPQSADAVLIGRDKRGRFTAYMFEAARNGPSPSWSPQRLDCDSCLQLATPADGDLEAAMRASGHDLWASQVDVETHGLALMRAQRATSPVVAGFCQITSVTADGVSTRVLERWTDDSANQ